MFLRWVWLFEFILELSLGIVAFLAENDIYYPSAAAWTGIEIAMFVLNLILWIVVAYLRTKSGSFRGSSLLRADTVYYLLAAVGHFILALSWTIFLARSGDLSPLDWIANPAAFAVFRILFTRQLTLVLLLCVFALFDARYWRLLYNNNRQRMRGQATSAVGEAKTTSTNRTTQ